MQIRTVSFCAITRITPLRRASRLGALLVWLMLPAELAMAQSPGPQFTMDSVNVRQQGVVSFSALALGRDSRTDFTGPRFLMGETDDQSFRLFIDLDSIQQVRFNAFTFTAYLARVKGAAQETYKYQVTGNPTGSFGDVPVRVAFHVNAGATATGWVRMPVYNASRNDLLVSDKPGGPAYVSVSGATPIQMRLDNAADSLPVSVTGIAVDEECLSCWTRISSAVTDKNPLQIDPGGSIKLPIDLFPNSIPALLQGALVVKPDVPHDTLAVTVTYHTVPAGAERRQTLMAPVRFGPGLFGLALALCGGIALGLSAKYLLTGRLGGDGESHLHALLSALVLGLIAEAAGVMLTAYGASKLVVFGLDIDPRQLFPAFILAILVSGGSAVGAWLKQLFGKPA